jgi:hypothetical protein
MAKSTAVKNERMTFLDDVRQRHLPIGPVGGG